MGDPNIKMHKQESDDGKESSQASLAKWFCRFRIDHQSNATGLCSKD